MTVATSTSMKRRWHVNGDWKHHLIDTRTGKPSESTIGCIIVVLFVDDDCNIQSSKKVGYQRWRKLHALNPILYILVTLHGLLIGTDFQGGVVAVVNIVPLLIMGIMLQKDKKQLSVSP